MGNTKKRPAKFLSALLLAPTIFLATFGIASAQEDEFYLDGKQPIEKRVDDLLSRLTLEEKVSLDHANSSLSTAGVPRLGIPELKMDDGPFGVGEEVGERFRVLNQTDDFATAMPSTLGLAATWNINLAFEFGAVIGQEAKQRGKNIMLGPAMNIQRTPLCGRNFEYMGEDPFLTSRTAVNYIEGEQAQGVFSCAKHFAANNQEYDRDSINEIIDERTLREIYLPAFRAAVQEAHVMAVMGAYNQVNGQYCCENQHLLNEILKDEWGFKGVVISDWGAVHHTDPAALNGLDIEMCSRPPFEKFNLANPFLEKLKTGKIPVSVLDEKVRRHLYVVFQLDLIHAPSGKNTIVSTAAQTPLSTKAHQEIARKVAEESFVLLKNKELLPLNVARLKTMAIIGGNAMAKFSYDGGSAKIKAPYEITALEGISNYLNGKAKIIYAKGYYPPDSSNSVPGDGSKLVAEAVAAAKSADAVVYVGGLNRKEGFDHEGWDRRDLKLPAGQDELLGKIVEANPKTVVVLIGGGAVEMGHAWLSRVPALLYAWYPGMEGGNALASVLFGDVNPSGKLPCTFPKKLADTPTTALDAYPGTNGTVIYKEGLLVGYRWYDTKKIEPLFPFGYGLSYTRFKYSKLKLVPDSNSKKSVTVEFELANTGGRAGAEIAEIYVQPVNPEVFRPLKELKGFRKVFLKAGEKQNVSVTLGADAFAYYDAGQKGWIAKEGEYKILVGSSSRDIRLDDKFKLR
ncbi:MAG: beta-glucosidase-like glycosyl hydrolase [Pedosphaera sp.]|nr:beta-glucosidase-like glycosyl hydrolase [Pedosphaera sp.]